jgi:putative copper export protein
MIFARWALFASALGVIGGFGATLINRAPDDRMMRIVRRASFVLILSCLLVLAAQLYAWFDVAGFTDPENLWTMLSITLWGLHWSWLFAAAVVTAIALAIAARQPRVWIYVSGAAALTLAAVVPLVGHGGTHDAVTTMLHRAHLFGAGLWVGSLAVALAAGVSDRTRLLSSLRRFAPIAMTGALMVAVTGTVLAWEHLRPFSVLWTTDYGRVLMAKVIGALLVGGLGFVNWREPKLRVIVSEVVIALLVVLTLTAWLSDLEPPSAGH